jgi:hypothetical protein
MWARRAILPGDGEQNDQPRCVHPQAETPRRRVLSPHSHRKRIVSGVAETAAFAARIDVKVRARKLIKWNGLQSLPPRISKPFRSASLALRAQEPFTQNHNTMSPLPDARGPPVCTENHVRVDDVIESPKLAE